MNILSEEPKIFCKELDFWIESITSQKSDEIFFTLYITLIDLIRSNALNFEIINDLEKQLKERKDQLNHTAYELCEREWRILWQYHPEWKFRRRLVEIRRLVACPLASTQPFIYQIIFLFDDLKADSSICVFLEKMTSIFLRSKPTKNYLRLSSLKMRISKKNIVGFGNAMRPLNQKLQKKIQLRKKKFERLYENSIEIGGLLLRLFVPGKTYIEQHHMLHYLAENDPVFLWERIKFLISCFQSDASFLQRSKKQPWHVSHQEKWRAAIKKTEHQIASAAKVEFEARNSSFLVPSKLNIEHQINRNDFEKHLYALVNYIKKRILPVPTLSHHQKNHIEINHNITVNNLYHKEEHTTNIQKETFEFIVASSAEAAVITHAKAFWSNHSEAKHNQVYADYVQKHPQTIRLSEARWGEIIRERRLDPRKSSEKIRGKDKGPRQKELY